jgi:hypothetical protein
MLSQPSYEFIKHLPVVEEEVDMLELDNMRELVADTLRAIGTRQAAAVLVMTGYRPASKRLTRTPSSYGT